LPLKRRAFIEGKRGAPGHQKGKGPLEGKGRLKARYQEEKVIKKREEKEKHDGREEVIELRKRSLAKRERRV